MFTRGIRPPPWFPVGPPPPGREGDVLDLVDILRRDHRAVLAGRTGLGRTAVAGAVARALGQPVLALSLLGCIDADDGVRALGDALGVLPCGDEIAIARGLLNHPTTLLVVIDDANSEESCRAVETLLESRTGRFLLMIHDGIWETATVTLSPLSGGGYHDAVGNPTVARLEGALGVPLAESLASVGAELQLLAALEAGVPRHFVPNVPTALLRPEARDRAVLRPGAAALAVTTVPPESEVLQAVFAPLLELGRGGHLARQLDPRDILLLRQAEAHVSDPAIIAELRCARVRLLLAAGQPIPARRLLRITFGTSSRATGLLRWAEVDVALHLGEPNTAWNAADLAAEALGMAGEVSARACLWRRLAERLAERGDIARADEAWRRARQAARQAGDDAGIAAAMRGAAGLALSRGEWVGAGALHEEAAENLHSAPLESLNLQLGELALALVRGEAGRIRQALDRLEGAAGSDALVSANLWRRRADALLRQGDLDGAGVAADRAAGLYAALGEWVARGCALRLGADVASLAGQPHEAFRRYDAALHVQLDSRDWRGIIRTLDHLAVLADHLGDAVGARRYRENRSATIRAMGSA